MLAAGAILAASRGSFALSNYPGLRSIGYASAFGIGVCGLAAITWYLRPWFWGGERQMQQIKSLTIPAVMSERVIGRRVAFDALLVIGASALIAIAAQIAIPIPFSPVPLTMQPLAVLLVGVVLGSRRGAAAAVLYLLEGVSGLPVFAQGHGGAIWLAAPTGGYLMSYPFAAFVAGWFSERGWGSNIGRAVTGMLAALAVIYAGGWMWLAALTDLRSAFVMGVAPFIIADILKVAFGAALLPFAQKLITRN